MNWIVARLVPALALCGGALGCGSGTETGNPGSEIGPLVTALPDSLPADVTLSRTWVSLPSTELSACTAGDAPRIGEAIAVDLLSGSARPRFANAGAEACGVVLELGPSSLGEPAELAGLTLVVEGIRGDALPFRIESELAHHLVLDAAAFPPRQAVIAFDLGLWLDAADLAGATTENGSVLVDADHNLDRLTALEAATPHAVALYLDGNANGSLDPDERTPIAVPP